jgi:threonine/homoserine/homoserine lactone efflux protein
MTEGRKDLLIGAVATALIVCIIMVVFYLLGEIMRTYAFVTLFIAFMGSVALVFVSRNVLRAQIRAQQNETARAIAEED